MLVFQVSVMMTSEDDQMMELIKDSGGDFTGERYKHDIRSEVV